MTTWYPGSGITWQQYLQANCFERNLKQAILNNAETISASIRLNTQSQVATAHQLQATFSEGIDVLSAGLDQLGARFEYSLGLLLDEARVQTKQFGQILQELDVIRRTLESPLLTQARELFRIGCDRLARGLLDKALQAFLEAEKKDDADFFTQLYLGKLYLHGRNEDDNVVDIKEAKKHLSMAVRFGKAELSRNRSFQTLTAEALFFASVACYVSPPALSELEAAKNLAAESVGLNPELSESWFHLAKYNALEGDIPQSLAALDRAVVLDPAYVAKAPADGAFQSIRGEIERYLDILQARAAKDAEASWSSAQELYLWAKKLRIGNQILDDQKAILEASELTSVSVDDARATRTYFGYRKMIQACAVMRRTTSSAVDIFLESAPKQAKDYLDWKIQSLRTEGMNRGEGCATGFFVLLFFFLVGGAASSPATDPHVGLYWLLALTAGAAIWLPWLSFRLRLQRTIADFAREIEGIEKLSDELRSTKARLDLVARGHAPNTGVRASRRVRSAASPRESKSRPPR